MKDEYDDLSVSIHLSYRQAERLELLIAERGNRTHEPILEAVMEAKRQAVKERQRQDSSARAGR